MFNFPQLKKLKRESRDFSGFLGLDKRVNAPYNTLSYSKNISAANFPVVSTRGDRKKIFWLLENEVITGICFLDRAYITTAYNGGTRLYYGDNFYDMTLGYTSIEGEKQTSLICSFNGKVCIFNLKSGGTEPTLLVSSVTTFDFPTRVAAPNFTDVTVFANRVIGCRKQQIRACAEGEIVDWDYNSQAVDEKQRAYLKNFKLSSDFTACVNFKNRAIFFTRDEMFELHGKNTQQFELMKIANVGCVNRESVCEVDGKLYFNSIEGVMCYSGNMPQNISAELCDVSVFDGIGYDSVMSAAADKVYCAFSGIGGYSLYCYNTVNKKWSREDDLRLVSACGYGGKNFIATQKEVYETENSGTNEEIEWQIETQDIYCASNMLKRRTRLELCAEGGKLAKLEAYIKFDNDEWEMLCASLYSGIKYFCLPISREDFSKYKIKLKGKGKTKLCSMNLSFSLGGEKNE